MTTNTDQAGDAATKTTPYTIDCQVLCPRDFESRAELREFLQGDEIDAYICLIGDALTNKHHDRGGEPHPIDCREAAALLLYDVKALVGAALRAGDGPSIIRNDNPPDDCLGYAIRLASIALADSDNLNANGAKWLLGDATTRWCMAAAQARLDLLPETDSPSEAEENESDQTEDEATVTALPPETKSPRDDSHLEVSGFPPVNPKTPAEVAKQTPREMLDGVKIRQGKAAPRIYASTETVDPPAIENGGDVVEWLDSDCKHWLYTAVALIEAKADPELAVCILLDLQHAFMAIVECLNTGELPAIEDLRDRKAVELVEAAKSLFESELESDDRNVHVLISAATRGFELAGERGA